MIHVCFSLHTMTRFLSTAMLSLFENNTPHLPSITVHLLHDNALANDSREKFIQIVNHYGQHIEFYNVEELCADRLSMIRECFSLNRYEKFSLATFYRLFIPYVLPKELEKAICLDADIVVNLDISELWQIELGNKPLAAVPNLFQMEDEGLSIERTNKFAICKEGVVRPENYFNAGVMLMNLKVLREEEDKMIEGMKFVGENSQFSFLDQEILNYCFSTSYLKLPVKFNRFVMLARPENEWYVDKKIYHFAASKVSLGMDKNDPFNRLFLDYFIKTPYFDADKANILSKPSLPFQKTCAVSVVIPMYNAEEFIAECLDSLLIQTFQDFEVIVVDDCSTDESPAIVESYKEKFGGRLMMTRTEVNSGGGGNVPRNIGMTLARGEYIQFLDADDMIVGNALETLYIAAILHEADVVYTASYYRLNAPNDIYLYKDDTSKKLSTIKTDLTVDDQDKNLSRLLFESGEGNFHASWTKFVRRYFLLENRMFFPNLLSAGDFIWVINVYCHARRFLRISTPLYFYRRYNNNSILRTVREPQEQCRHWFSAFADFAKSLYELENKNEILAKNPDYCLSTLKKFFSWCLNRTEDARKELDSKEIYKILHESFANASIASAAILPFIFGFICDEKKINASYMRLIDKFSPFITARIDIKFVSTTGDFQILSLSDENTKLMKPKWLQKDGVGYIINSWNSKLTFVIKATVPGRVDLSFKGKHELNPEDKSKRIPYWIDYTKFTINEKTIFNKLTPAWHDKPYKYSMNAKADEEIKIHIEWQPHRADTIEVKTVAPPAPKVTVPEPKVATPPPAKVESSVPNESSSLSTARIDVKLMSPAGDLQILSVSDDKATVQKPAWFQKDGVGYKIQSYVKKIIVLAKATVDGKINFILKGIAVPSPEDNSKRIPYWIDYTKFTINGKTIFNTRTPTWHDRPYKYTMDVKADEEIKIQVEWQSHSIDI